MKKMPRRSCMGAAAGWVPTTGCMVALLFTLSCSSPQQMAGRAGTKQRLSIATGGTGGVYYPYGGGLAKIISDNVPDVEATAEVTAASVDNVKFLRDRKADIAFVLADTLADALNGHGAFEGNKVPLRAIAVLYTNYTHVVALASGAVKSVADLKGKVVATGAAGSGTEVIAFRLLEAAGINHNTDIRRQSLGVAQSVDAIKDGKIDALFWSGGLPTAAVLDLAHTPGTRIRLLSNNRELPALQKTYGESLYSLISIPKTAYPGLDQDVPVIGVSNVLVVHERMTDALVYAITRTLFEHQPELAAIHPEAKNLTLASAVKGSSAPFHPGAMRYYREQHVWPE